ncbi:DsbA family protein [Paenibacillus lautus]|uniref:DsbA family oxidoreductase n=1 Tax=Paenibacillus lautus TaxID=1401 RepID=UPI003D2BB8A5
MGTKLIWRNMHGHSLGHENMQRKGGAYIQRVFSAYYQEEKDIGKVSVLTSLAAELGLDEMEFKQALETRRYQEALQKALHHAYYESGVRAVPTYIIGNQVLQGFHRTNTIPGTIFRGDHWGRKTPV